MNSKKAFQYLLFGALGFLFLQVIWPFRAVIVMAGVAAVVSYPFYRMLTSKLKMSSGLAAFVTMGAAVMLVALPFVVLLGLVIRESIHAATTFDGAAAVQFLSQFNGMEVGNYVVNIDEIQKNAATLIQNSGTTLFNTAKDLSTKTAQLTFGAVMTLFLYFYFLKDSNYLLAQIHKILPFTKAQNQKLTQECKAVARTVFLGNLITAVLSGLVAYGAFTLFNVQAALIWALLAGLLSLIPTIGSLIVYVTVALIVGVNQDPMTALMLIAFYLAVEMVLLQNLIKPKLVDEKIQVHPILVFFSLVGGVEVFGSIGVLYGPLIVVLFVSMYEFVYGKK